MTSSSRPPYSSGIREPNSPNAFIWATIASGYRSSCSKSEATGMTSLRTHSRTVATSSSASSGSVAMAAIQAQTTRRPQSVDGSECTRDGAGRPEAVQSERVQIAETPAHHDEQLCGRVHDVHDAVVVDASVLAKGLLMRDGPQRER